MLGNRKRRIVVVAAKTPTMEGSQEYCSDDAKAILQTKRSHWNIENQLHWVLDIAFREDESRVRKDHAAENVAVLRHMALNLLKREKTAKGGIHAKRWQAGRNNDYLLTVLKS